jgi:endo-1,4-beta-D-glucanase Y
LSWPIYDPVNNFEAYLDPYTITFGRVNTVRWNGSYFTSTLYVLVNEAARNNIWYAFSGIVKWAYESSPLAVIPLDYDRDYVPYQELRNAFGFSINGVDQPGWNADDIVRVLRELFPNRAWAVFDDRQYVLYLYNLTPDYVPDWLIEKLSPTAMKVLQPPADVAVAKAWLDLLNERNAQIPPQAELP